MYRNVSLKMDKIFPKYYITYFGLCNFFNNGYLFSYDAVFLGHPVLNTNFTLAKNKIQANFAVFICSLCSASDCTSSQNLEPDHSRPTRYSVQVYSTVQSISSPVHKILHNVVKSTQNCVWFKY